MKRHFVKKPVLASTSTRDRISDLEERIDELEGLIEDCHDENLLVDLYLELAELKDQLNFAWQDDEAEYNYAVEQQEFNPDGSLKYYDDFVEGSTDLTEYASTGEGYVENIKSALLDEDISVLDVYCTADYTADDEDDSICVVAVIEGDWKGDHARADEIVSNLFECDESYTQETANPTGSDSFTGKHTYIWYK